MTHIYKDSVAEDSVGKRNWSSVGTLNNIYDLKKVLKPADFHICLIELNMVYSEIVVQWIVVRYC